MAIFHLESGLFEKILGAKTSFSKKLPKLQEAQPVFLFKRSYSTHGDGKA